MPVTKLWNMERHKYFKVFKKEKKEIIIKKTLKAVIP